MIFAEDNNSSGLAYPFLSKITFGMVPRGNVGLYTNSMTALVPVCTLIVVDSAHYGTCLTSLCIEFPRYLDPQQFKVLSLFSQQYWFAMLLKGYQDFIENKLIIFTSMHIIRNKTTRLQYWT